MQERSISPSRAPLPLGSDAPTPLLVCFSHLRWDFVWQRPQHLLTRAARHYRAVPIEAPICTPGTAPPPPPLPPRAARHYRVLLIEEPIFKPGIAPHMDISNRPQGITVAVPMLP